MERDEVYIRHILDAIVAVESYTKNISKEEFLNREHQMMQDAVIRQLEIIGEVVKHIFLTV